MNFIDDIISFTRKYLCKINFGKIELYLKVREIDDCEVNYKNIESRVSIKEISLNSIIEGRLTISIPGNVASKVSEIIVVSE
ncbi:MAG TPA: hypothetical protein PKK61_13570 [Defluviitaleaceae bacterium]|nr:hypothetical protein [Defluviitaleaceae bacterium]